MTHVVTGSFYFLNLSYTDSVILITKDNFFAEEYDRDKCINFIDL